MVDGRKTRTLRILHVAPHMRQGGAERLLHTLVTRPSAGFLHHVALMQDDIFFDKAGLSVEGLGFDITRPFGALMHLPTARAQLRALIASFRPDVVQGWLYYGAFVALAARGRASLAWSIHNTTLPPPLTNPPLHLVDRALAAYSAAGPSAIVYCARSARKFHELRGYAAAPGVVIENGVDPDIFRPDPVRRAAMRSRLGIDTAAVAVLLSARNDAQKDLPNCLDAFAIFRRREPKALLLTAGRGMDVTNTGLSALIEARGLCNAVLRLGPVVDMPSLLDAVDVALLGSRYGEASPMALIEALTMDKPIAATRVGDVEHLPCPREALAPPADPVALATALAFARRGDPVWQSCFDATRARYGLDAMIGAYEALYHRLAEERAA